MTQYFRFGVEEWKKERGRLKIRRVVVTHIAPGNTQYRFNYGCSLRNVDWSGLQL